ncbi:hypothetical protein BDZ89DRAFT_70224 [Hymenopellis radicata]|nr:hypothetical protein BDZ89DRAFT_70224 [Hymenopellis radicata]
MRTIDGSEVPSQQYLPSCPAYTSSMTRRKIVGLLKSAIPVASMELRAAVEASDWPRWEREARTYAQAVVQSYAPQVFWAVEEEKISLEEGFELLGKEQRRWMGYVSQDTYAKFKARVDSARSKPSPSPSAPVKPSPSEAAKPTTFSGSSRLASASDEELCASRTRAMCSSPAPSPLRKEVDAVETTPTTSAPLPPSRPAPVPPVHPPSSAPPRIVQTTAPKLTEDTRRPSIPPRNLRRLQDLRKLPCSSDASQVRLRSQGLIRHHVHILPPLTLLRLGHDVVARDVATTVVGHRTRMHRHLAVLSQNLPIHPLTRHLLFPRPLMLRLRLQQLNR